MDSLLVLLLAGFVSGWQAGWLADKQAGLPCRRAKVTRRVRCGRARNPACPMRTTCGACSGGALPPPAMLCHALPATAPLYATLLHAPPRLFSHRATSRAASCPLGISIIFIISPLSLLSILYLYYIHSVMLIDWL